MACLCPRGGIGIRGRLRACARKGVEVQVLSGAFQTLGALPSVLFSQSMTHFKFVVVY